VSWQNVYWRGATLEAEPQIGPRRFGQTERSERDGRAGGKPA